MKYSQKEAKYRVQLKRALRKRGFPIGGYLNEMPTNELEILYSKMVEENNDLSDFNTELGT